MANCEVGKIDDVVQAVYRCYEVFGKAIQVDNHGRGYKESNNGHFGKGRWNEHFCCDNCSKVGNKPSDCWYKGSQKTSVTCYTCQQPGQYSSQCPYKGYTQIM